jgi:pimeloyl-ACP methyl ester carboxylesterase
MATPVFAYALLKATYSENVRNPADAVTPIIKRALFNYGAGAVGDATLQKKIQKIWGLDIPLNVIHYSLPRLASGGIVYLDRTTYQYKLVDPQYTDQDVIDREKLARELYNRTRTRIERVLVDLGIHDMSGGEVLEDWLETSALSFLGGINPAYNANTGDRVVLRIVSTALLSYEFSEELTRDLAEIALGASLYRAVKELTEFSDSDLDASDIHKKMENVEVYLDTPILIRVLGYGRAELNQAASELLAMCAATGCKLRAFVHTVEELQRIIRNSAAIISERWNFDRRDFGRDIIAYAMEKGLDPPELIELAANIPSSVTGAGIEIIEPAKLTIELSIDERELEEALKEQLVNQTSVARVTDISSLSAIYRLRSGQPCKFLETCRAIFITSNKGLADVATRFFQKAFHDDGKTNVVQLCMTDVVFTTRLWPKLPTGSINIPTSQIVSHTLSSLFPSPRVVASFLEHIKTLVSSGRISEKDGIGLQISRFLDQALISELDGDVRELTTGQTVSVGKRVLEDQRAVLRKMRDEDRATIEKEFTSTIDTMQSENESLQRELELLKRSLPKSDIRAEQEVHLVILIHGINTRALWMSEIAPALKEAGFRVAPTSFGKYGTMRFLCPFGWPRRAAINRVVDEIKLAEELHKPDKVSVIAHSFGTYVFFYILQNCTQFRFYRVIFCGSVVGDSLPFREVLNRFQAPLLNEVGSADYWPAIAESAGWGYGAAGINNALVDTRWHVGLRHSDFLKASFCRKFWLPFLTSGDVVPGDKAMPLPRTISLITKLPLRWIIVLGVISLALLTFDVTLRRTVGVNIIGSMWSAVEGVLHR